MGWEKLHAIVWRALGQLDGRRSRVRTDFPHSPTSSEESSFGSITLTFLQGIFFQGFFTRKILFFSPLKDSQILERENNYLVETLEEGQRLLVALAALSLPGSEASS